MAGMLISALGKGLIRPDGSVDIESVIALLNDLRKACITLWDSGPTTDRPVDPLFSQLYYDTTTAQYLYCSAVRDRATPAQWTPLGTGGGGGAPIDATYVVMSLDPTLTKERVLTAGSGITITDGGANGPVTISSSAGGGTVTSVSANPPIKVTPSPITGTGVIDHLPSGVSPGTYGDATHVAQFVVEADGHITSATNVALPTFLVAGWASVTMIAGGGGGATAIAAANSGPGGGSGETVQIFQMKLTPGAVVSYTVGAGGASDTDGGDTSFAGFFVRGGKKGISNSNSGAGGGAAGAAGVTAANPGLIGGPESACWFGGSSGGGRATAIGNNGGLGGGSGGFLNGGAGGLAGGGNAGGGGGASSVYGLGGAGGAGGSAGVAATSTNYGAGGGGGGGPTNAGGAGAGGYLLVTYLGGAFEVTTPGSGTWTVPT